MKNISKLTVLGLIISTGAALFAPTIANADGLQQSKNTWRNIATGAAVLTGIGIANHNSTETALGAFGTIVGLTQYEQARQEQSVQQNGGDGYCAPANGNVYYNRYGDGSRMRHDNIIVEQRDGFRFDRRSNDRDHRDRFDQDNRQYR